MNLRKEPILFGCAAALALYLLSGSEAKKVRSTAKAPPKPVPVAAMPVVILADPNARVAPVEVFREPTEAVPLPPTELPFPAIGRLPVVAPPLPGGPMPATYWLHRMPGVEPVAHEFPAHKDPEVRDPEPPVGPGVQQRALVEAELAQRFDRVWTLPGSQVQWGLILGPDKYSLRATGPFNEPLRFQYISRNTGLPSGGPPQIIEANKVEKIQLADSLENRIALKRRELSNSQESVQRRIEFIANLIDESRKDPAIWIEAEREADALVQITKSEVGYLELLRVLRAEGDLGKELALYQGLPESLADGAFRWREQGRLEARLGLDADAEAHLREAVARQTADARANHALASFLLSRGRALEALPFAVQAERSSSQSVGEGVEWNVTVTLASVQLALGQLDDAAATLDGARGAGNAVGIARGVLEYSRGNLEAAAASFEPEAEKQGDLEAAYALGACRLRQGRFDEARDLFERVRDGAPTLRARALASLGLLYERTAHDDLARAALDDAMRADPRDPWIVYLRGRSLRLAGELDEAIAQLREAMQLGDDFVEALAECGLALRAKGLADGVDAPEAFARAARYFDRAVDLDSTRSKATLFVEIQGEILAQIGEVARARRAFESIADKGSDFARIGLAILDYRQKRSNDARAALAVLQTDVSGARSTRDTAQAIIDLIDDNASKEQVRDAFQREEVGQTWKLQGALSPSLRSEELRFTGNTSPVGAESFMRRTLKRAGGFLRCEVSFVLHAATPLPSAVGLRIVNPERSGDFSIEVGFTRFGGNLEPMVKVIDGQPRNGESQEPIRLEGLDLDLTGRQTVAIEVVPDGDRSSHRFNLRIEWNGRVVHEHASLRQLTENSPFALATDLYCAGKPIDVGFDDYRLVRRRETK